ncbi:hypothetical protein F2Q69_00059183 [Brassica cretica]|uniref:Uncharacterized protein n=1 Tax=Brassica cretica TaxID=69181 RepID=A0A8S9RKH8_BRACR|nr:hypothetical protein F2Q69_00059183 [Brassica cretica]
MHGFVSYRRSGRVRSLRNDRAAYVLGRYVATELRLELVRYVATELRLELGRYVATELRLELGRYIEKLGRYIATEPCACSVATLRPSFGSSSVATELWLEPGRYVATEPCACSIAT